MRSTSGLRPTAARRPGRIRFAGLLVLSLGFAGCASTPSPSPSTASPQPTATNTPVPTATDTPIPTDSPAPTPTPGPPGVAPLDGVTTDAALARRLPVAVTIDDNAVARPQSGFNAASIVYQAPADGGEDRYMLVFQEQEAPDLGPVRSGRPYFVKWAAEYRAAFAHFGGDAKTLAYIPSIAGSLIYNVDALVVGAPTFHRIGSRVAPHNAYSGSDVIRAWAIRHGAPGTFADGLATRPFSDDAPLASRPAKGSITIPYGTGTTTYTYDRATNAYLRSVAGAAQFDPADGKRVVARNVVVLFMALSIDPQSEPGYRRPVLAQIGTGKAIVFRDGRAIVGTWRKRDVGDLTRFFDAAGNEIPLVRGRIFIQVVPTGTSVTYAAAK